MKRVVWGALLLGLFFLSGCLGPSPNHPPIASFVLGPDQGYAPLQVLFDASSCYDPDGDRLAFNWDFGDGTKGTGKVAEHTYSSAGTYTVTLCVTDARGAEASLSKEVLVSPVPDGMILRRYSWEYQGVSQSLEFLFPEPLYLTYHNQVRQPFIDNYNYGDYVLEPRDDPTLSDLAHALVSKVNGDRITDLDYILSFVQGTVRYVEDAPGFEYPLYPLETLVDGAGDCEDTTILYVSLVRALGYPVSMAFVDTNQDGTPDHVFGLVPIFQSEVAEISPPAGKAGIWTIDGKLYAVAETAVNPELSGYLSLGTDPWGIGPEAIKQEWDF